MAEEVRYATCRRYACLLLACVVIMVAGTILTFSNYATHLKHEFDLTQNAVEVIGAAGNIGAACGYPAGLFFEHVGSTSSFFLALILTGGSMVLLYTTQFAVTFYHTNWALLALYLCFFGFGSIFMFLVPTSVCMANFPARVRGTVVGITAAFFMVGPAVFGLIYATLFREGHLGNYFLLLAIVCVVMNLLSMWIIHPIPQQEDASGSQEQLCEDENHHVSFINDNGICSTDGWFERLGLDLMKVPAFHILSWCFLLGCSLQLLVFANITTIAVSFRLNDLAVTLPIFGPLVAFAITLLFGYISDRTFKYISRLAYVTAGQSIQGLFFILSVFLGDNWHVFCGFVISAYANNGFLFALIPTLMSEYFGTHHFMRNWGAELMANALLALVLGTIAGALYQNVITDGTTECFGLVCFQGTFIMGSVMCGISVFLCGIMWYMERKKAREYERI